MMPTKPEKASAAQKAPDNLRNRARKTASPRNGERLRLGLTGLGAIFLIVMVVAAGLKPSFRPTAADRQGESLAVLGVAPGASSPATPPHP